MNVIQTACDSGVKSVVALSTDKACNPVNLYGATKLASDKLFVASNSLTESARKFAVVRYGNVMGSRGSCYSFFIDCAKTGTVPITDERMTRFMISLEDGVGLVGAHSESMIGGEIFVKIPSMKISDIAKAAAPDAKHKFVGIRPGEKLHEQMISYEDAPHTYEYEDYYKILPAIHQWSSDPLRMGNGKKVQVVSAMSPNTNSFFDRRRT